MSLPPIAGTLTTAFAALAGFTTLVTFAALGSTGTVDVPRPGGHRGWRPRSAPVASAATVPVAPGNSAEDTGFFIDPSWPPAADAIPIVRVLGLSLCVAPMPPTASLEARELAGFLPTCDRAEPEPAPSRREPVELDGS